MEPTQSLLDSAYSDVSLTLHTFPVQDVFVWRHEQGTMIEMDNEELVIKRFNDRRVPFLSWPISPLPGLTTSFTKSWLLLVKIPRLSDDLEFPALGDAFKIDMEATVRRHGETFTLMQLCSTRIPNPYEDIETVSPGVRSCAAFKVDVPRSWDNDEGASIQLDLMEEFRIASSVDDLMHITTEAKPQNITIQWGSATVTSAAELAALRHLVEVKRIQDRRPSSTSLLAFKTIQNFQGVDKSYTNLHSVFPQLQDPADPANGVPRLLRKRFRELNNDQKKAYYGLTKVPNSLYFVNGCPGSGKTEWNILLSALIQSGNHGHGKSEKAPVLFLVDINKTVDDAANRYFNLCKAAGLRRQIVRMHGWPYEMRNSGVLHCGPANSEGADTQADFTKSFLATESLSRHTTLKRSPDKAPTLDEAAWEYFERHRSQEPFSSIIRILEQMKAGEIMSTSDWKRLRSVVSCLYRAVLSQADFIATTPVAAYGSFPKLFRPRVIFFDEAPHARELTTLISIAYFDPFVWIFTGDVKQTHPFVKGGDRREMKRLSLKFNPFADQLRFSTMARAAAVGALNGELLVNTRAHGNLHRLPSAMFYGGKMKSSHTTPAAMYPPSTIHLKERLRSLGDGGHELNENRVIIQLKGSSEMMLRNSFWNPTHHKWVMQFAETLLTDKKFVSVPDNRLPGSIIIQSPYSTAVRQYHTAVNNWPEEWRRRAQVLTVDKAQGNQADVIILDMVRTTTAGFMDDPFRLNVSITRAKQAEIIIMHQMMTMRMNRGQIERTHYTSKLWENAHEDGRLFNL